VVVLARELRVKEVSGLWVLRHKDILQLALKHLDEPLWKFDCFSAISSSKIAQEVIERVVE